MDLEFSEDQTLLRETLRRFVNDHLDTREVVRPTIEGASTDLDALWRGLGELGVTGLLVPTRAGGAGAGLVDAAVVLEELGRACAPLPYAETAVGAATLLSQANHPDTREHADDLLAAVAAGTKRVALGLFEPGRRYSWPEAEAFVDDGRLSGEKATVAHAESCDDAIVVARDRDGLGAFLVDLRAPGVSTTDDDALDRTRPSATCTFASVPARRLGIGDQTATIEGAVDRLGVALTIDAVGAASVALEQSVEYAREREQFGVPIGSFQAVQHLCADMLSAIELARAGAYYACWAADDTDPVEAHRAALLAQAWAADELGAVGASAIQVFGGIGFTWEHDIHIFYKRVLSASLALGSADDHLMALADAVL